MTESPISPLPDVDVLTTTSWLFTPGSRPDRFDRAMTSGASVVILDLEDSGYVGWRGTLPESAVTAETAAGLDDAAIIRRLHGPCRAPRSGRRALWPADCLAALRGTRQVYQVGQSALRPVTPPESDLR